MIFASLVIEREPLQWNELGAAVGAWLQDAGGVAALCLVVYLLSRYLSQRFTPGATAPGVRRARWETGLIVAGVLGALAAYVVSGVMFLSEQPLSISAVTPEGRAFTYFIYPQADWWLSIAGACALFAVCLPVLLSIGRRLHVRRIWALARLSFKEALHRRVVWVFCLMGLVFLFAGWFIPYKSEDQVRNYVWVVYFVMAVLLWLTGSLLGAFSIPNDVRNQTIHTIVTKPVERYEIVLGRFLGYGSLLTIVLAVLTGVSLLYVVRGVTAEAAEESYKARVPVFADDLAFYGTPGNKGESVGREWAYRQYLPGPNPSAPNAPKPYAYWSYLTLPASLANRTEPVPFEFSFDIFRTTKGEIGKGVFCTLTFVSGHLNIPEVEALAEKVRQERTKMRKDVGRGPDLKAELERIENDLLARYGLYEAASTEVTDYHTQSLTVPAALFKKLIADGAVQQEEEQKLRDRERQELEEVRRTRPAAEYQQRVKALAEEQAQRAASKPTMKVLVTIDRSSRNQLLGMARRDLYLLEAERPFWQNFVKGAIGLWFSVMMVLGLAVALSTYLSGIISWFCAMFLFIAGFFLDYIRSLAENRSDAGGPMVSLFRIANRMTMNAPLDQTPTVSVASGTDEVYRWWLRHFLKVIPDVNRFDLTTYVGNGFDIPWSGILFLDNLLPLLAYLLPWAILAYYLMESREVANPS
jgi:hypothetical protein